MNGSHEFVDTNVVVYAHDAGAGEKHLRARALMEQLWASRSGCVSIQVLQEFFVTITRKVPKPLSPGTARQIIRDLSLWNVHSPEAADVLAAIDRHARADISFWDAMVVQSAAALGCGILHTEDLKPGQVIDGVRISNPFG